MGMSGARRLDRLEQNQERTMELVGALGNRVDRLIDRQDGLLRRLDAHDVEHDRWEDGHAKHVEEHESRHRFLDLRVYGALGIVGAAAAVSIARGPI
jgi:hypothetical protein